MLQHDSDHESSDSEPPLKLAKRSAHGCAKCGITVSSLFRPIETQSYALLVKNYTLERPDSKVICNGCDRFVRTPDLTRSATSRQEVTISIMLYYIISIYTKIFVWLGVTGSILGHDDD